jgi:phosphohistidine phosphatase
VARRSHGSAGGCQALRLPRYIARRTTMLGSVQDLQAGPMQLSCGMLTLSLLRHAKSSWADARLTDVERPLNDRGEKAAPRMGAFMARNGLAPQLILCSSAVRARQTLDLVLPFLKGKPEVAYEEALYLASPATMLKRLHKVSAKVHHTMIVGHDPGLHMLALQLAGTGTETEMTALTQKFPTAGLAVIEFEVRTWSRVKPDGGRLALFTAPKRLLTAA